MQSGNNLRTSRTLIPHSSIDAPSGDNTSISESTVNDIAPSFIKEINSKKTEEAKPTSILDHSVNLSSKSSSVLNKYSLSTPVNKARYPVLKFFQNIYLNICKLLDIAPKKSHKLDLSKTIFESFLKNESGVNEKPQMIIKFIVVQMENQLKADNLESQDAKAINQYVDNLKFLMKTYDLLDSISSNSDIQSVNRDLDKLTSIVEKRLENLEVGQELLLPAPLKYNNQIGQGLLRVVKEEGETFIAKVITFDSNFEDNLFTIGNKKYPYFEWSGVSDTQVLGSLKAIYQFQHPFYGKVSGNKGTFMKGANLIIDLMDKSSVGDDGKDGQTVSKDKNPIDILSTNYGSSPHKIIEDDSTAQNLVKKGKQYRDNKLFLYVLKDSNPRLYQESSLYVEAKTIEMIWSENPEIKTDSKYCREIESSIRKLVNKAENLGVDLGSLSRLRQIQQELVDLRKSESVDFSEVKVDQVVGSAPLPKVIKIDQLSKSKVQKQTYTHSSVTELNRVSTNIIDQLKNEHNIDIKYQKELGQALAPLYQQCRELYNEGSLEELQSLIQDITVALPLTDLESKNQIKNFATMLSNASKEASVLTGLDTKAKEPYYNDKPSTLFFNELSSMLFECYKVNGHTSNPDLLATTALIQTFTNLSMYVNMGENIIFIPPQSIIDRMDQDPHFIISDPILREKCGQMRNFWDSKYVFDKTLTLLPNYEEFVAKITCKTPSSKDIQTKNSLKNLNILSKRYSSEYQNCFISNYSKLDNLENSDLYQALDSLFSDKDFFYAVDSKSILPPPFDGMQRMEIMQEVIATDSRAVMGDMASNVSVCLSYLNKQTKADALSRNNNIRGLFGELHSHTRRNLKQLPSKDKHGNRTFSNITTTNTTINLENGYHIDYASDPNLAEEWNTCHDYLHDSTLKGVNNNFDETFTKGVLGFKLAEQNKNDYSELTEKTLIDLDTKTSIGIDSKYKNLMLCQNKHGLQTALTTFTQDVYELEDDLVFDFVCHKLSSVGATQKLYKDNPVLFKSYAENLNKQLQICKTAHNFFLAGRINYLLYQLNLSTTSLNYNINQYECVIESLKEVNILIDKCSNQQVLSDLHLQRLELLSHIIRIQTSEQLLGNFKLTAESLAALSINPIPKDKQTTAKLILENKMHKACLGYFAEHPIHHRELADILLQVHIPNYESNKNIEINSNKFPILVAGEYTIDLNSLSVSEGGSVKSYLPEAVASQLTTIQALASHEIDPRTTSFNKVIYDDKSTGESLSIYTPANNESLRIIHQTGKVVIQELAEVNGKALWIENLSSDDQQKLIGLDRLPASIGHLFNKGTLVREVKHPERMHILDKEGQTIYRINIKQSDSGSIKVKSITNSEGYTLASISKASSNHISFIEKIDSLEHSLLWVDKNQKPKTIEMPRIQSDDGVSLSLHIQPEGKIITSGMLNGFEVLQNSSDHPEPSFISGNDLPSLSDQYFLLYNPETKTSKVLFNVSPKNVSDDSAWSIDAKNKYPIAGNGKQTNMLLDIHSETGQFNIHKLKDHEKAYLGYVYMSSHQYEDAIKFISDSYHTGQLHTVQLSSYDYILNLPDKSPQALAIKLKTQLDFLKNLKQQKESITFDTELAEYKLLMELSNDYQAIENQLQSPLLKLSHEEEVLYDELLSTSILDTLSLKDPTLANPKVSNQIIENCIKASDTKTLAVKLWLEAKPQKSTKVSNELSLSGDKSLTRGIKTWFDKIRGPCEKHNTAKKEALLNASSCPVDITQVYADIITKSGVAENTEANKKFSTIESKETAQIQVHVNFLTQALKNLTNLHGKIGDLSDRLTDSNIENGASLKTNLDKLSQILNENRPEEIALVKSDILSIVDSLDETQEESAEIKSSIAALFETLDSNEYKIQSHINALSYALEINNHFKVLDLEKKISALSATLDSRESEKIAEIKTNLASLQEAINRDSYQGVAKFKNSAAIIKTIMSPHLRRPLYGLLDTEPEKYCLLTRLERHDLFIQSLETIRDLDLTVQLDKKLSENIAKTIEDLNTLSEFDRLKLHPHFVNKYSIASIQPNNLLNQDCLLKLQDIKRITSAIQYQGKQYKEEGVNALKNNDLIKMHQFNRTLCKNLFNGFVGIDGDSIILNDDYIFLLNSTEVNIKEYVRNQLEEFEPKLSLLTKQIFRMSFDEIITQDGAPIKKPILLHQLKETLLNKQIDIAEQILTAQDKFFEMLNERSIELEMAILSVPPDSDVINNFLNDLAQDPTVFKGNTARVLIPFLFDFANEDFEIDNIDKFIASSQSLNRTMNSSYTTCDPIYALSFALQSYQGENKSSIPKEEYDNYIGNISSILHNTRLTSSKKISLIKNSLESKEEYSDSLNTFLTSVNDFAQKPGEKLISIANGEDLTYGQNYHQQLAKFTLVFNQMLDMDQDPYSILTPYSNSKSAYNARGNDSIEELNQGVKYIPLQKLTSIYNEKIQDPNADCGSYKQQMKYELLVRYVEHLLNSDSLPESHRNFLERMMEDPINIHIKSPEDSLFYDLIPDKLKYIHALEKIDDVFNSDTGDKDLKHLAQTLIQILKGKTLSSMEKLLELNKEVFLENGTELNINLEEAQQSVKTTTEEINSMMPTTKSAISVQSYLNKYAKLMPVVDSEEFEKLKFPEEWTKRNVIEQFVRLPDIDQKQPRELSKFFSLIDETYAKYFGFDEVSLLKRLKDANLVIEDDTTEESLFDSFESLEPIKMESLFDPQGLFELNKVMEAGGYSIEKDMDFFDVVDILRIEKKLGLLRDLKAKKNLNAQAKKYIENIEVDVLQAIKNEAASKNSKTNVSGIEVEQSPIRAKDATLAYIQELDEDIEFFKTQEEIKASKMDLDSLPKNARSLQTFKEQYLDELQYAPNTNRPYSKKIQDTLSSIHKMLNIKPSSDTDTTITQETFPERLIGLYVDDRVTPKAIKAQFGIKLNDKQAASLEHLVSQYMTLQTDEKVSKYLSKLCDELNFEEDGSLSNTSIGEIQLIQSFVNDYENYRNYVLESSSDTIDAELTQKQVRKENYRCLQSIEYSNGFVLRSNQVDTIKAMLNEESIIKQLGMGQGKSSVILPFLLNSYADGNTLALGIVPEGLYPIVAGELTESCKNIFNKDLYRFEFSRDLLVSQRKFKEIYINFAQAIDNKSPVLTTRTSLLSFRNMYIEKMKQHQVLLKTLRLPDSTDPMQLKEELELLAEQGAFEPNDLIQIINNIDDLRYMAKTLSLLKSNSKAICDEVDSILDVQIELNYAFGELANLDPQIINAGIDVFTTINTIARSDNEHSALFDMIRTNEQTFMSAEDRLQIQTTLAQTYFEKFKTFLLDSGLSEDQLVNQGFDLDSFTAYIISSDQDKNASTDLPTWLVNSQDLDYSDELGSVKDAIGNLRQTIQALETTLQKSNSEGYGRGHNGIDTVPYKASNTPSNSEYGDVFERVAYTLQDYYQQGLSNIQVNEYLDGVLKQIEKEISHSILTEDEEIAPDKTQAYQKFQERLERLGFDNITIYDLTSDPAHLQTYISKLNESPENQFAFLKQDVFPLFQMANNQISSNAFDLVDMLGDFNGFTGTPWNIHSFHSKLNTSTAVTKGTEGRLGEYLQSEFKNGNVQIHTFKSTDDDGNPLPADELFHAMGQASRGGDLLTYDAFIDAGAMCRDYTLNEVVSTLSQKVSGKDPATHSGIIYVNEDNNKKVLRNTKESPSVTNDSLDFNDAKPKPGECFTFYDQIHVIGTDIKQSKNARALVTISEKTMIKDLKQAIARMRGLRQGQHIDFIISDRVKILILKQRQELISKLEEEIEFAIQQNLDEGYITKLEAKLITLEEKSDELDIDDIRHFCIANQAKRVAELNTHGQMMEIKSKLPQTAFWNMTQTFANTFDNLFDQIENEIDLSASEDLIEKSLESITPALLLSTVYAQQVFNIADEHLVSSTAVTTDQKIQQTTSMETKVVLEQQMQNSSKNLSEYANQMGLVNACHLGIRSKVKTKSTRKAFINRKLKSLENKYNKAKSPSEPSSGSSITSSFNSFFKYLSKSSDEESTKIEKDQSSEEVEDFGPTYYDLTLKNSFEEQRSDLKTKIAESYDLEHIIVEDDSPIFKATENIQSTIKYNTALGSACSKLFNVPILEDRYLTETMQTSASTTAYSEMEVETQREQERETQTEIKKVAQAVNTHVKRSAITFNNVNQLWSSLEPEGFAHSLNTLNDNYSKNIFISDNIVQKNTNAKSELKKHPRVTPETCVMLTNTTTGEVKCFLIDINDYDERIKPLIDNKIKAPEIVMQVMPLQVSSQSKVYDTNVSFAYKNTFDNTLGPDQTNLLIQSKHYSQVYQLYDQNEKDAFEDWKSSWNEPEEMNKLYTNFILSPQKRERYLEYQKAV